MKSKTPLAKLGLRRIVKAIIPRDWWNLIRERRIRNVISGYDDYIARHTYAGYPFKVKIADPLAESWYDHDWNEYPDFPMLKRRRLREGAIVFDIGAHQGIVAMILAMIVGETGKVVAVEANEHNAAVAKENKHLNEMDQLEIKDAAVSNTSGTLIFNTNLNGQVDSGDAEWGQREVEAVTIDQLAKEYGRPDVLFIDIEGFECHAFEGASEVMIGKPDCCVEVHVGAGLEQLGGSIEKLLSFFPEKDYDLFICPEDPHDEYVTYSSTSEILDERFFLIALGKGARSA